jgi:uncharacterized membrane protein
MAFHMRFGISFTLITVVSLLHLYGTGTEEAIYAQFGESGNINLRGLLLGGILIGVLGVLDDITTAQVAVVDELKKANQNFKLKDLYTRRCGSVEC